MKHAICFSFMVMLFGIAAAQNPVSYGNVKSYTHVADFDFLDWERDVVQEKIVTFYSPQPQKLTFKVLVRPDGSVKYVRTPRVDPALHPLRVGGADALYQYTFSAVEEETGNQWVEVRMSVGDEAED